MTKQEKIIAKQAELIELYKSIIPDYFSPYMADVKNALANLQSEPKEEMYPKESVMKAINDEPELPGEMPDEIYYSFKDDKGALAELLRITVKETKKGIRNRLLEIK
jgi:hypothetical protein